MTGGHRRILVVEDDPETAGQVVESLTTGGYQVDLATSGNEALSRGVATDYAVITIDRMLPDIDGIAVMRQLRDDGIAAPVLIISALGEVDDRVRGLRAGGDDYLVKPFAFKELVVRLRALVRRGSSGADAPGERLTMNPALHAMTVNGETITLTPTEYRLLAKLASLPGEVVRRRELTLAAWPDGAIVHDNTLDAYVARIRRKLREAGRDDALVTVHGVGYRLE
jgi:two-component system OmpR family response regulator